MQQENNISLNFTGDISFTGVFRNPVINNFEVFDKKILDSFNKADFNIVNLEGPTTNKKTFFRNDGLVNSPINSIAYLKQRNINVFNLANNHLFDNGPEGYKDTIKAINNNKCLSFGGGVNLKEASNAISLNKNGLSIALIGVCHKEGMIAKTNTPGIFCIENNFELLRKIVANLKEKHDWVIINYHGGEEYTQIPMPSRRALLRKMTTTNADIIIAHHSHTFQGYEVYNSKPIFYSLGNFIFDIPPHKNINFINQSAILNFKFLKNRFSFNFLPIEIDIKHGKIITGNPDFLNTIKELSKKITTNYIKNWKKDAHRTFFNAQKQITNPNISKIGKRHQSIGKLLFSKDTFYKFYRLLKSKNKRPLFLGALMYKISK